MPGYDELAGLTVGEVAELERRAYWRGHSDGASMARSDVDRWAELLLQVSAAMRGKDRGDGPITTTIYPDPQVYGWSSR